MKRAYFVCLVLCLASLSESQSPLTRKTSQSLISSDHFRWQSGASVLPKGLHQRRGARTNTQQSSGLNFAPAVTYGSGGNDPFSIAVADVNGDGKPDIVVGDYCDTCTTGLVGVLLGNGDGTFQKTVTYSSGGAFGVFSVAVADVNGDGRPDLIVGNDCESLADCNDGSVGVLLGNGDGTFREAVTYLSGGYRATSVAVRDLNEDGKPDLVVANCGVSGNSCPNSTGLVGILLGNGDGTFQTAMTYPSGGP